MGRVNFDKLTRMEQRVVIAKDLLLRLKARKFVPTQGEYLQAANLRDQRRMNAAENSQVRQALEGIRCKGCEIGGLFLCAVDRHNKLTIGDIGYIKNNDFDCAGISPDGFRAIN